MRGNNFVSLSKAVKTNSPRVINQHAKEIIAARLDLPAGAHRFGPRAAPPIAISPAQPRFERQRQRVIHQEFEAIHLRHSFADGPVRVSAPR